MAQRHVVRRTLALAAVVAVTVTAAAHPAAGSTSVTMVVERGGHALWFDETPGGTTRWFIVSAYEATSAGFEYSVARFATFEGTFDPDTGWTWLWFLGGFTNQSTIEFSQGGRVMDLSGDFELFTCDDADCNSGFQWLGASDVVTASWRATPDRPDGSPGLHHTDFSGAGCLVDIASGALMHRPADATATWNGLTFPQSTTDFANAEIEFASNSTIQVCVP